MKISIFKSIVVFLLTTVILLILIVLYDFANYDSSYINRNSLTFSINNLNSKKIRKLFIYYDKLFYKIGYKFSKKHKEFWKPEDPSVRDKLPTQHIYSKTNISSEEKKRWDINKK